MPCYLGIDTSNYTTSVCLYDRDTDLLFPQKLLLPVPPHTVGLRQSDAVFQHVKQLPALLTALFAAHPCDISGVCVSTRPRSVEGSYMPAFLAGKLAAEAIAAAKGIPVYECSHQEGHIVAALHSAGQMGLLQEEFYAFHVSGGTTECLLVTPLNQTADKQFEVTLLAKTLDLNAGQLIDRVGVMLGMSFPCGSELDALSRQWAEKIRFKPSLKGLDCHLSGVQNQCETLQKQSVPLPQIARHAIEAVKETIGAMTAEVLSAYGKKPILYAGGVMSNSLIKEELTARYGAYFAAPAFSADNAAGVAIIGAMSLGKKWIKAPVTQ